MTITVFDLAGAEEARRFSPFCWRTKMALAHKGLPFEAVPWRFTEKDRLPGGQTTVPVIVDGEKIVGDSWAIADYLDAAYPDRPPLFRSAGERSLAKFVTAWTEAVVQAGLVRMLLLDILGHLHEKDRDYFRKSREARVGMSLEACCADREERLGAWRQSLAPLRVMLKSQPYLGGDAPNYADYVVLGAFQWARAISPLQLLAADDPVASWRARMLDAFDGLAGKAPGYPV